MTAAPTAAGAAEYRSFPNFRHRKALQQQLEVPALVRLLRVPPNRRILEVGCGRGAALPALARLCRPSRLTGLDVEAAFLADADAALAEAGISAELVHGDVRRMPFADRSFDVVVDFGTCYHVSRPQEALGEIQRVLSPGGLFVHETPLGQLIAHPVRSLGRRLPWQSAPALGRRLPWQSAPALGRERRALLWASERKE